MKKEKEKKEEKYEVTLKRNTLVSWVTYGKGKHFVNKDMYEVLKHFSV